MHVHAQLRGGGGGGGGSISIGRVYIKGLASCALATGPASAYGIYHTNYIPEDSSAVARAVSTCCFCAGACTGKIPLEIPTGRGAMFFLELTAHISS